ncbi:translation initiation factor eIF-3, subunit D [Exidia glandulosa HHB12029]|uniref:Eukaryotic translation initiation factor 3 subunit D n=1 Tax=Exidia glandulosa HHB12029 TaxID=1314781 RepID=A0A165HE74_EXIGL|nr:translation initiation factor eIF-3, subunit D [Exidia glandulosa HHB12029]
MVSFTLPAIQDNPDGSWGPSPSHVPAQFRDIPYAPYSKSDKLGRVADWNDTDTSRGAGAGAATLGAATLQSGTGGGGGQRGNAGQGRFQGRNQREGQQPFGSGASNAFAYFHVEDEASFSLVDNKTGTAKRGGPLSFARGRGGASSRGGAIGGRGQFRGGRGGQGGGRWNGGGNMRGGRWQGGGRWDKQARLRESSVPISPNWKMLEEIEFSRLSKLRLDVDEPELLSAHGKLYPYDKTYDRVTTKTEKPLQIMDRLRYNPTTSDDPVIQQLAANNTAQIYTTDSILAMLMCAPRSVYSWDIVIVREGDKLFLDKRDGGPLDFLTVNENAMDPPLDTDKESINSAISLALEATYVNQNFLFQAVRESDQAMELGGPNPFHTPEDGDGSELASCGYRYRLFDLSVTEEEDVKIAVRTEVDAFIPGATEQFINIRALNEFDSRSQGAGGAPDWRTKLDAQRGAVVATEMKNNSCKLARWAVASMLSGAEVLKLGYISRANPRDNARHVVLSTSTLRPIDFANQLNISVANGWGIVRGIADVCLKLPDGKYVLVRDPNRPVMRLYAVPMNAFTGEDEEDGIPEDGDEETA